jgi:hypothetical protein
MRRSLVRNLLSAVALVASATASVVSAEPIVAKPPTTKDGKPYSAPTAATIPVRPLWGNTHLHTVNSFDAGIMGTRVEPEDAFRLARGEQVVSTTGVPAKLSRPLDFLVVSDHSDYMGLPDALQAGAPELLADPVGKEIYTAYNDKNGGSFALFNRFITDISTGKPSLTAPALAKSAWQHAVSAAEKYNEPGRFSAFIGYEWSSTPGGDNLHRNVIFRDGAEKALKVLPFTTFESQDPEKLWQWLSDYQQKTGGQVLAIPHNSNLSGGLMFADRTFGGKPLDRAYAERRARWEPVAEITQSKGDSETLPVLSPDDEFANFERWDKTNIMGSKDDKPEDQPFNYLRPSLTRGLAYEARIGVNPFKLGFVGGTDSHTGLTTVDADNFFGMTPSGEPSPGRLTAASLKSDMKVKLPSVAEVDSSGLSAVWAPENTRTAIFDALRRKEVYATTGPRITVRVFAGWDFKPADAGRSDFASFGYAHGVPMGGDLSAAHKGQVPTLVIQAAKDPEGANLDRVQVIKGWVDASGGTHEKVFDVAWSGDRKPGSDSKLPAVGNTVDAKTASYSNSIGAAAFDNAWTDPAFDPTERAYYYIRVIEIPTPRWTTYDAVRFGAEAPKNLPASVTQRAYTSPIWYAPLGA